MRLHILGICGTFMGGIAALARAMGHEVSGSDADAYPPMSQQLAELGIPVQKGYTAGALEPPPDRLIVGNALSRGNPAVEHALDAGIALTSGPAWLAQQVLAGRHVLAVAGTHGKTTTASALAWVLEQAGLAPGFLIGGVPGGFGVSARLGEGRCFVVEADEYDTAFFDKRAKFVHYWPRTLILNNLEYDHADIFADLEAIRREFHHLVRTVPGSGRIVSNARDAELESVLTRGCWTAVERFGAQGARWRTEPRGRDYSSFDAIRDDTVLGHVSWPMVGAHNADNALAAIAAAEHAGVPPQRACEALGSFRGVSRRLEVVDEVGGVTVYDDFAHHPTAIAATLEALRSKAPQDRILALLEPRSNTMRRGVHREALADALGAADRALLLQPPDVDWDLRTVADALDGRGSVHADVDSMVAAAVEAARPGDRLVLMSNGAFGNIREKLPAALRARPPDG